MSTGCQSTDYQEEFSTAEVEKSGIYNDHEWNGLNSLCDVRTGLMNLNFVRVSKYFSNASTGNYNCVRAVLRCDAVRRGCQHFGYPEEGSVTFLRTSVYIDLYCVLLGSALFIQRDHTLINYPVRQGIFFSKTLCRWWLKKSHATHSKIFVNGCNSVQFGWINTKCRCDHTRTHAGHGML
jgi:hypothetical protein